MQTAVSSVSCSGNVLDLNAYRRIRRNDPPFFPEGPIEDDEPGLLWDDEPDPGTFAEEDEASPFALPFPGVDTYWARPSLSTLLDMAASAAIIISALAATAAVLL